MTKRHLNCEGNFYLDVYFDEDWQYWFELPCCDIHGGPLSDSEITTKVN